MLGAQGARKGRSDKDLAREARAALQLTPMGEEQWLQRADRIAPPFRRWVEIARILAADPHIVLLDEPSAGVGHSDTAHLMEVIALMRERNLGVLLVTHDVSLAASLCNRIVVMHNGRVLATDTPARILTDPEVIVTYLGEKGRRAAAVALEHKKTEVAH
ncbi:hypothetical protein JNW88_20765 [Micromonospora sp. ATA32]|nr:hypothetical protein [Micromonospora sp. ATA32]